MTEPPVIQPSDLSGYLASRGWRREGSWRGAGVWELEDSRRLLVPDRVEFQDDGELLAEAVRKLAEFEERPEREILLDIAEPTVDSQYFRTHPAAPSGTTPLSSGVRAVQGIQELMKAAARTVEEGPSMLFEGTRSQRVEDFLGTITLGSAVPGSYVLVTRAPGAVVRQPQLKLGLWDESTSQRAELAGREVLSLLYKATVAARSAAAASVAAGSVLLDLFDDSLETGVSANLCKALADLGGHARDRPFEIGFTWARGLPGQEPTEPVAFTGSMAAMLGRAGSELERMAKLGRGQITGHVESLSIRDQEPKIKVVGEFHAERGETVRRSLWVRVSNDQYDRAFEAQRRGWPVAAAGRLITANRRREMEPERFEVLRT